MNAQEAATNFALHKLGFEEIRVNQRCIDDFTDCIWIKLNIHVVILAQYSNKFMHSIILYSIVLSRSQLYCIVNLLLCGYNTIQCYA